MDISKLFADAAVMPIANISFQSLDHLREAIQITNTLFMCKLQTIDQFMPFENLYYQSPSAREVRDFKYFSHKDFCDDLSQIPWETIITINDPK